jgi:TPR repeat protein
VYRRGEGVAANAAEALRFGEIAASKGHAHAMVLVGEMLERGEGTTEGPSGAVEWYRTALEFNYVGAAERLPSYIATEGPSQGTSRLQRDYTQQQVSWDQKGRP